MSAHQYRITVEYLGGKHSGSELHQPIIFEAGNHDDIINIIETDRAVQMYGRGTSAALVVDETSTDTGGNGSLS
jgi:hypothetical protein